MLIHHTGPPRWLSTEPSTLISINYLVISKWCRNWHARCHLPHSLHSEGYCWWHQHKPQQTLSQQCPTFGDKGLRFKMGSAGLDERKLLVGFQRWPLLELCSWIPRLILRNNEMVLKNRFYEICPSSPFSCRRQDLSVWDVLQVLFHKQQPLKTQKETRGQEICLRDLQQVVLPEGCHVRSPEEAPGR